MKTIAQDKLKAIFETYLNGNISDAKEQTKALSKEHRKFLYQQVVMRFSNEEIKFNDKKSQFFFNLI